MSADRNTPLHLFNAATMQHGAQHLITDQYRSQVVVDDAPDGSKILRGVRIFKTGELTDSLGRKKIWTTADLQQMADNFNLLRNTGVFKDVPIRTDHTTSVRDLAGYFANVYLDPSDPNFLCSDLQLTEPDAYEKWRRGTFRNRSLEVGQYTTEKGDSYYPTVMGLAFVDIPAVEGLHNKNVSDVVQFSQVVVDQGAGMSQGQAPDPATDPQGWATAANYAKALEDWTTAANYAQACDDWIKAANYAKALDDHFNAQNQQQPPAPGVTGGNQQQPPVLATFRVNGQNVQDYMRVQAHIDALEGAIAEQTLQNRQSFVNKLVEDRKVAAPQKDSLNALVLTMTPEQFSAFQASYKDAPSLFQQYGQQQDPNNQGSGSGSPTGTDPQSDIETAKEIVANHRRAGMDPEAIKASASFQKLVKAGIESA